MLQKSQTVGSVLLQWCCEWHHSGRRSCQLRVPDPPEGRAKQENSCSHLAQEVPPNNTRSVSKWASFGSEELEWWKCFFCTLKLQLQGQGVWTWGKSQSWFNWMYLSCRDISVNISGKGFLIFLILVVCEFKWFHLSKNTQIFASLGRLAFQELLSLVEEGPSVLEANVMQASLWPVWDCLPGRREVSTLVLTVVLLFHRNP